MDRAKNPIKWLKRVFCDHDYEIVKQDYYKDNSSVVMYQRYICKKCGQHLIKEFRSASEMF